jgi:hypothetical protein
LSDIFDFGFDHNGPKAGDLIDKNSMICDLLHYWERGLEFLDDILCLSGFALEYITNDEHRFPSRLTN